MIGPSTSIDDLLANPVSFGSVDIDASARKHGVHDEDMLHALRNHWRTFATDDPSITVFIGPRRNGEPLELLVVEDEDGEATIPFDAAENEVFEGLVDAMTKTSRAERLAAYERWADLVEVEDLVVLDTSSLKALRELADQRETVEAELDAAVRRARLDNRSWSQIGLMLGVSKQAAQRKYAERCRVA